MRVFITSTPEELEPHQAAAVDVARELGLEPVLRDPAGVRGMKPVDACARQVARTDLVLALVGHRRGGVPSPRLGGDGFHPWTWWETRAAFEHGLPVTVLMAAEDWRPELREDDARGGAVLRDFRGELGRLAVFFEDDGDEGFRELVRAQLAAVRRETSASPAAPERKHSTDVADLRLRRWPPPKLPERPYPVLLPYTHPNLLAGRERELAELRQLLARPVPILGLHAASGTGKSSLPADDVLRDATDEGRTLASALPHDLSGPQRFHAWPLPPLGTPPPGSDDRAAEAARAFQAAIEKPLELTSAEGEPLYPWSFAADGASRLARAFGEARARRSRRSCPRAGA